MLDDLQWADAGSIGLLFHLGHHLNHSRILIVGIYRPVDLTLGNEGKRYPLASVVNEFQRRFGDNQIDLRKAEGREFVELFLDTKPNRLSEPFRGALYRHTYGNPLFTIEMLRGMQERGDLIQDTAGRWIEGANIDWSTLPARIEGVIGERIGRLPPNLQELLRIASVEGETFTAEAIARVQDADEEELVKRLDSELDKQHHLVTGQSNLQIGAQHLSQYHFRHILFQKYLYDSVGAAERAHLHHRVGNALEVLYENQTEEIAVQLARHFRAAGVTEKAVDYLLQAGNKALRLSAYEEAITHLTRGLALLDSLPDTPKRAQQELDLQIALGTAFMSTIGYGAPEAELTHTRARELGKLLDETPQLSAILLRLWGYAFVRGDLRRAYQLAEQLRYRAHSAQDTVVALETHLMLGASSLFTGKPTSALSHLEQAIDLYDRDQHHALAHDYAGDPCVFCMSYTAQALWLLGYPSQAMDKMRDTLELAHELGHPYSFVFALSMATVIHHFCQETQLVQERATTVVTLSTEQGLAQWEAHATIMRGWTLTEQEKAEEGIEQTRRGLVAWQATGSGLARTYYLALLAEVYLRIGELETGFSTLGEAFAAADQRDERWWEAELHRLQGELLLTQGEDTKAEASFHRAIEVARRQQAKSLELRAVMSLSRLWQKQRNVEEARGLLAETYGWFTEGFDTPDLQAAQALLQQLSA